MGQSIKLTSYALTSIVLIAIAYYCIYYTNAMLLHSSLTHSLVQSIATLIAFFVGCAALYRYYKVEVKNAMLLFIGVGFLGTSVIDAYHTIVTSMAFLSAFPDFPPSISRWSWVATRIVLSILLVLSLFKFAHEGTESRVNEKAIYAVVIFVTLAILVIFSTVQIPFPTYPDKLIARPEELIPGAIFLIALIGYLIKGQWKTNVLSHWIVLSLIAGVICQVFYMAEAKHLFDLMYMNAHFVKILSYAMAYMGITTI